MPLAVLFVAITLAFAGIAAAGALGGRWPVALAAGVLALWMGNLAWSAAARARRGRRSGGS